MKFVPTTLPGAVVVELELVEDERGWFARTFSREEFARHGLDVAVDQCSHSFTHRRGTLRGLHYQVSPHAEAKLVRCVRGTIHDVIVDLRQDAGTYLKSFATTLSAERRNALYVPAGFAHGWLSLTDDVEVLYQMSAPYDAASARGLRWNDPALGIEWPLAPTTISERDASFPLLAGKAED